MPTPERRHMRHYARRSEIARAVSAARANGVMVAGLELAPDGTIRISSIAASDKTTSNEFDHWDAAGRL